MEADTELLDEIIVVGYGTQVKRNVSTSISSVSASKLGNIATATDPAKAMVGQIAGVRLQQASGAPGENSAIRVRGSGSITSGNNPLYVIDGFPTSDGNLFSSILPSDIESIDVLKDAASAAIYGSRAGNGVIIVTTKKGKQGKTQFTADVAVGFEQVAKRYDLLKADDFVDMVKEALTHNNKAIPDFLNNKSRWAETDWQDVIFRTAPFYKYQITATGGNEKSRFSISGGYVDQQGVLINSFMKRYNFRVNFDANLTPKLKIGASILPSYSIYRDQNPMGPNTSSDVNGIIAEALSMPPVLPVYQPNGDHFIIFQDDEFKSMFNGTLSNPLNKLEANKDYRKIFRQSANVFLDYEPLKGLLLNTTFNAGITSGIRDMYISGIMAKRGNLTGNISTPDLSAINARRDSYRNINWYWSNTATYHFLLQDHDFTFLLGYDISMQNDFGVNLTPRTDKDNPVAFDNFIVENIQGAILNQGSSYFNEYAFDAFFGRINYNYKGKYLFSTSLRRDRSSKFGPQNRSGIFPSISGAWNVSDESFLESLNWLSLLKIRASYGVTGNDQLAGYYSWISTMSKEYYVFGHGSDNRVVGYRPSGFSNEKLGWEKNKQVDVGVDFSFFNNRVGLMVDLYKRNSNTILNASVPIINGKSGTIIQNVGNIENKGLEVTFNSVNLEGPLTWKSDFNISFNRNKILELGMNQTQLRNNTAGTFWNDVVRNYVGRPMSDLYMYKVIGTMPMMLQSIPRWVRRM
jgi:TonB-linked SusC/RagA family outer membrane protein